MCFACQGKAFGNLFSRERGRRSSDIDMTRRQFVAAGIAAGTLATIPPPPAFANPAPPVVFRGGRIYTVEESQPWAEAVVVRGNRIVYVGDESGAAAVAGQDADILDLNGRMLLPGFVEAHWHLGTLTFAAGAWINYDTKEEILEALREYARENPAKDFILGFGWIAPNFPATGPRKEDLDKIFPDRPALLISSDLHNYWVNSKLLDLAGITRDTPREVVLGASWYEKDPLTGEPTGSIVEIPALFAVVKALAQVGIEPFSAPATAAAIELWQPRLAAAGITTIFDAGFALWPDEQHRGLDILVELEARGKLLHRVVGSLYHNDPTVDPLPMLRRYAARYRTPLVQANVLKLLADGTELSHTSYLLDPYTDRPDWRGEPLFPQEILNRIVREADAEGIDTHIHATGDAAVRMCLDAYAAAFQANAPRDRRHTVCHAWLTTPADIARCRSLGIIVNTQIQWGVPDAYQLLVRERMGEQRWNGMYPFKSYMDQGVIVSFGTDALATGYKVVYKPLEAIQAGHTRQEPGKPEGPLLPPADERLSIAQLIRGYTLNGAYQLRMEDRIGSIKPGKLADLVVLDRNLFETPARDIGKVGVDLTMMDGRITHRSGI